MHRFDFLIDYNLRGQAKWLWRTIESESWLMDMLPAPIRFIQFEEAGLSFEKQQSILIRCITASYLYLSPTSNSTNTNPITI